MNFPRWIVVLACWLVMLSGIFCLCTLLVVCLDRFYFKLVRHFDIFAAFMAAYQKRMRDRDAKKEASEAAK